MSKLSLISLIFFRFCLNIRLGEQLVLLLFRHCILVKKCALLSSDLVKKKPNLSDLSPKRNSKCFEEN